MAVRSVSRLGEMAFADANYAAFTARVFRGRCAEAFCKERGLNPRICLLLTELLFLPRIP